MEQNTNIGNLQTFEEFLATQNVKISLLGFLINLVIAGVMAYLLNRIYIKHGSSLSNRRSFAGNFVLITLTTMIIITIVKSSLALSLGLVGALSIVRFRTAIKEPEELSYLFFNIAIGLGLGADQRLITLIGFVLVAGYLLVRNTGKRQNEHENLLLTVSTTEPKEETVSKVVSVLKEYCSALELKRLDENGSLMEASFLVEFDDFNRFNESKSALKKLDGSMAFSFIDNKGMI